MWVQGLSHVIKSLNSQLLSKLLPEVKVFARVSPKQKVILVTRYMCTLVVQRDVGGGGGGGGGVGEE